MIAELDFAGGDSDPTEAHGLRVVTVHAGRIRAAHRFVAGVKFKQKFRRLARATYKALETVLARRASAHRIVRRRSEWHRAVAIKVAHPLATGPMNQQRLLLRLERDEGEWLKSPEIYL